MSSSLTARLLTRVGTSVVNMPLTEPRHLRITEMWPKVRIPVSNLAGLLRSRLPCGTQSSFNPQTVASPAGYVLAVCSTCGLVVSADVAVCRGMLRQRTSSTLQVNTSNALPLRIRPKLSNHRHSRCCHAQLHSAYAPGKRMSEDLLLGLAT
jgi:hypothetical protein